MPTYRIIQYFGTATHIGVVTVVSIVLSGQWDINSHSWAAVKEGGCQLA